MREILYRGKSKDSELMTEEWVYGYFWKEFDDRVFIGADVGAEWDSEKYRTLVEVIPETVGQYTGLKDKNGKEIFEGDVVKYFKNDLAVIIYRGGGVDIRSINWKLCMPIQRRTATIEVIGNITDNPELVAE